MGGGNDRRVYVGEDRERLVEGRGHPLEQRTHVIPCMGGEVADVTADRQRRPLSPDEHAAHRGLLLDPAGNRERLVRDTQVDGVPDLGAADADLGDSVGDREIDGL